MDRSFILVIALGLCLIGALAAWNMNNESGTHLRPKTKIKPSPAITSFSQISPIVSNTCMFCHSEKRVAEVIEKTKKATFKEIAGFPREEIINELEFLQEEVLANRLNFTSEKQFLDFIKGTPQKIPQVLSYQGVMPPEWAEELMKTLPWDYGQVFVPLTIENRMRILEFVKTKEHNSPVYRRYF